MIPLGYKTAIVIESVRSTASIPTQTGFQCWRSNPALPGRNIINEFFLAQRIPGSLPGNIHELVPTRTNRWPHDGEDVRILVAEGK